MYKSIFSGAPVDPDCKKSEGASRDLVARYSRGNINLQQKRYVTKEEKEARLKKVFEYKIV